MSAPRSRLTPGRMSRVLGPWPFLAFAWLPLVLAGCTSQLDTTYGRSRNQSINGTGAVAALFRAEGHEVRTAQRLTSELEEWAGVIVRFAQAPGPPDREEAQWYSRWLSSGNNRALIYVPRDYDAVADYWSAVLERLPQGPGPSEQQRERARKLRGEAEARQTSSKVPPRAKQPAGPDEWFAVEVPKSPAAVVCRVLSRPWSRGVDASKAALPRHEVLKTGPETVLLAGDDQPLVIEWTLNNGGRVLVVSSGSFLLNGALLNPARRLLAQRVVEWPGKPLRHVALVEGTGVLGEKHGPRSIFELLGIFPFGWIAAQMLALGLAGCLARAPRLGRARPEPTSDIDRPAAHAEALGTLLARTRQPERAREPLEAFRQWRRKPTPGQGLSE